MKIKPYFYKLFCLLLLSSCSTSEYDSSFKGEDKIFFAHHETTDSVSYSFANYPAAEFKDLQLKLQIMGGTSIRDRQVIISVDDENTTAVPDEYELPQHIIIPAGAVTAECPLRIKNSPRLETGQIKLTLKLEPSSDFKVDPEKPGKIYELVKFRIFWTNVLLKPNDWPGAWGGYSKVKHRLVIDLTGYSQFSGTAWDNEGLTYKVIGICNEWLDNYNANNPGAPYRDENGNIIRFSASSY